MAEETLSLTVNYNLMVDRSSYSRCPHEIVHLQNKMIPV